MIPPPPQGYKLVDNKEIPIVPEGTMFFGYSGAPFCCDKWRPSMRVGGKPCDEFQYAIPTPTTEPESQDELITTQRRVIEILVANREKEEARFQALRQESDQMLDVIAQQQSEIDALKAVNESHSECVAEVRANLKYLTLITA